MQVQEWHGPRPGSLVGEQERADPGRAQDGVCPCAGTHSLSWAWHRQRLAVGPSPLVQGQGWGCRTHPTTIHPPDIPGTTSAGLLLLRLGHVPAAGRAGGSVAAIATATRLCLKPSSEMSRLSLGSGSRCQDENFLLGCGNVPGGEFHSELPPLCGQRELCLCRGRWSEDAGLTPGGQSCGAGAAAALSQGPWGG